MAVNPLRSNWNDFFLVPGSGMTEFRDIFHSSKHVVVITGGGISVESDIPTFLGVGGIWRNHKVQDLASYETFRKEPSMVWEFYHYQRELMKDKEPNPAHISLAKAEKLLSKEKRRLVVITQNIDNLHKKAGSKKLIELHGSVFRTRCIVCGYMEKNNKSPACNALHGRGSPEPNAETIQIPESELPRCIECNGLMRPDVVWFGENIDDILYDRALWEINKCDLCIVVGTSSLAFPISLFAYKAISRGIPVAEFNIEPHKDINYRFHFQGPSGIVLPIAIAPKISPLEKEYM